MPVIRIVDCAKQPWGLLHQRPQAQCFMRRKYLGSDPLRLSDGYVVQILVHAIVCVSHPQLSALVPPDCLTGFSLESFIDTYCPRDKPPIAVAEAIQGHQSGCMPSRASCELRPLQKAAIRPTAMRKAI